MLCQNHKVMKKLMCWYTLYQVNKKYINKPQINKERGNWVIKVLKKYIRENPDHQILPSNSSLITADFNPTSWRNLNLYIQLKKYKYWLLPNRWTPVLRRSDELVHQPAGPSVQSLILGRGASILQEGREKTSAVFPGHMTPRGSSQISVFNLEDAG